MMMAEVTGRVRVTVEFLDRNELETQLFETDNAEMFESLEYERPPDGGAPVSTGKYHFQVRGWTGHDVFPEGK